MRAFRLIVPLALVASPVLAETRPAAPPTKPSEPVVVPPELTDPATAEKLARMMQALSQAFLNLPVGEMEAAVEGRPANSADRRRTVREVGRSEDPNFEQDFQREIAGSRALVQTSMKALAAALPAMLKGLAEAGRELDKATANLPSPNYPKQ